MFLFFGETVLGLGDLKSAVAVEGDEADAEVGTICGWGMVGAIGQIGAEGKGMERQKGN